MMILKTVRLDRITKEMKVLEKKKKFFSGPPTLRTRGNEEEPAQENENEWPGEWLWKLIVESQS